MQDQAALLYPNRAFRGAYTKGRNAARAGKKRETCPYTDKRTWRGQRAGVKQTWSRGFIDAWQRGFDDETRAPSGPREGELL